MNDKLIPLGKRDELKILLFKRSFLENYILLENDFENKELLTKVIFLGTKYIYLNRHTKDDSYEDINLNLDIVNSLISLMKLLTINEFIEIFPIEKNYDGEKYCSKDYPYVMEILNRRDKDKVINKDIHDVLWNYHNKEIRVLMVTLMMKINHVQKVNNEPTLTDAFAKFFNVPVYKKITHKNKEYLIDIKNRKTIKLVKQYPSYLRRVK